MPLLEISNLSVRIPTPDGDVNAVRAVSLEIERGEIHGVIGESGCGKTMTGMALLGLVPQGARIAAERFHFDGEDLRDNAVRLRGRRIGLISQDPAAALNPVLSIARQMDDVIRAHRAMPKQARRAEAASLLAATGLPDPERVLKSYPHQLSGGMQQRVVIAQALATGADFLIADEPTTALDVSVGAQVLALLRKLVTERGLTVLMITHDMDVIAEACDRATVLYAGRSVETGPVDAVLQSPGHPYTRALLAALPPSDAGEPSGADSENAYVLELFSWPANPSSWWKRIEMPQVRILNSNLERAPCVWQLVTPSSEHLISTSDSLLPDYQWSWNQVWMARQDTRSQSDLEKEIGASVQPDVGQQVNQYSLISLDTKEAVHATFIPRFLLWTPLALLTLTLSSLLLRNGWNRKAIVLIVAIPLLAGLISWSLDITILVTQSMVVSCAILLIYAFVEWLLDRNARKKSVFAGRGTFAGSVSGSRMDSRSESPSGSASKSVLTTIAPGAEVIAGGPVAGEMGSHGSRQ